MSEQKKSTSYESELASKCQGLARCISFSGQGCEPEIKPVLLAASHCLDKHSVRVHKKKDGLLIINARGAARFMTWRERLARWILQDRLEIRP